MVLATQVRPAPSTSSGSASATRRHQAGSAPPAARGDATSQAPSTPCRVIHSANASSRSAVASGSAPGPVTTSSRRRASRPASCSPVIAPVASDHREVSIVSDSVVRPSTARTVAAAGLLISWARPAASVPSVMSDSRWRTVASIVRAVPSTPSIRCPPRGNQASDSSRRAVTGTQSRRLGSAPTPVAR